MQTFLEEKQAQNVASGRPRNAGLVWTDGLRVEVVRLFKQGQSIPELATYFERTEGAILAELVRQGIIRQHEIQNYRWQSDE